MVEYIQYMVKGCWRMLVDFQGRLVWRVGTAVEYDKAWLKVWQNYGTESMLKDAGGSSRQAYEEHKHYDKESM